MNNFLKLNSKFQSLDNIKNFLNLGNHEWKAIGYGFDIISIPDYLIGDQTIRKIMLEFGVRAFIFRTPAKFWYKWHVDSARTAAINIIIESEDSHTIYGDDADHNNKKNIQELVYETNSIYLLNTKLQHSVLNLGKERYVLSIGFDEPITYDIVKEYCFSNNL